MFTGIIQAVGHVASRERSGGDMRIRVASGTLDLTDLRVGDSVAVNGVCLTAVTLTGDGFWADVSGETLARTTLAGLDDGDAVNLEKALLPTTRLGGHLVSGHVDGIGEVVERGTDARSVRLRIRVPQGLAKYIAEKGSICVDGVSLTVNAVAGNVFDLNIVPHTLKATALGGLAVGGAVNLEVDLLARYLERLLLGDRAGEPGVGISRELLAEHGFLK